MRQTIFSPCRKYRYTLWREWSGLALDMFDGTNEGERGSRLGEYVQFIGLNPSTADETQDDPTIRRCIDFAKRWGFGALCMTNLFAFRATDPRELRMQKEYPGGPENFDWLLNISSGAGLIVAAWGRDGKLGGQQEIVLDLLNDRTIYCLGFNSDGTPVHPLYQPSIAKPILFTTNTNTNHEIQTETQSLVVPGPEPEPDGQTPEAHPAVQ